MIQIKKYTLIVAYDGTHYCGWQEQPQLPSVSSIIKKNFEKIFNTSVQLFGASRTDAGVHALGQIVMIKTFLNVGCSSIQKALNNVLPTDITVRSVTYSNDNFHPWYNVRLKKYYYHFFVDQPLPFVARYGWHYRYKIDFDTLEKVLSVFIGTHNFRSFACAQDTRENMIRTIESIKLVYIEKFHVYRIEVTGKKFLRYMIRRIVGAALYAASHSAITNEQVIAILKKEDPHHLLPTAPAQGLVLRRIYYY